MTQEQLNTLDQLFEETKYDELITEIESQGLDLDSSFLPKLALAYFHTEAYKKSTELFEKICADSNDPVEWFNLSLSAIRNKNEIRGLEALSQAMKYNRETETNGEGITVPFMRLYAARAFYNAEAYNHAYNQLNELADIYGALSNTDDRFLYSKGVPLFDEFVKLAKDVLPKQEVVNPKDWIPYVSLRLDEAGKNEMEKI